MFKVFKVIKFLIHDRGFKIRYIKQNNLIKEHAFNKDFGKDDFDISYILMKLDKIEELLRFYV